MIADALGRRLGPWKDAAPEIVVRGQIVHVGRRIAGEQRRFEKQMRFLDVTVMAAEWLVVEYQFFYAAFEGLLEPMKVNVSQLGKYWPVELLIKTRVLRAAWHRLYFHCLLFHVFIAQSRLQGIGKRWERVLPNYTW